MVLRIRTLVSDKTALCNLNKEEKGIVRLSVNAFNSDVFILSAFLFFELLSMFQNAMEIV